VWNENKMLSSLFRDESEHARAIPLCFLPKGRHLIEYDPKVYTPVLLTVDNSGFLNPIGKIISSLFFRSRLQEDFQPFPLTRLSPLPGSLPAVWVYSFPSSPFKDGLNYNGKTLLPQGLFFMDIQLGGLTLPSNATAIRPTKGGSIATASLLTVRLPAIPLRYLYSGWQSWSLTAWVDINRPIRPMRPSSMHPMQTDPVYAKETRPHGSWYGAVELPDGKVLFLGALGLESHVMLDSQSLVGWYETGNGDWFLASGDESDFMARYAEILSERFGKGTAKTPYHVWCSWYSLYTGIQENQLLKILSDLEGLPFDVFQVDDGWQIGIGDWEANTKFPSGMDKLASQIKGSGRKAGLWLAPLLVVPSSSVYHKHRDWLLHDEKGKPVSAGFNWGEQLFAIDTTHPDALKWLADLMKKIRVWGYDYAKLDFLYAGALPGRRHVDIPREEAYRNGLKVLRSALGEAYLLTCGAPILPSIGVCDGMRVGPDVAETFTSHRDDDLLMNFAAPGVRNALRTTLNRLWLKPVVHTDPDVVYFRSKKINLTLNQKLLIRNLAQISNFKATSDIPAWMTDSERADLREFLISEPKIQKTGQTSYLIGNHEVDFSSHILMPALPGAFTNLQGTVIGALANVRMVMKVVEKYWEYLQKIKLKRNPV
jgi:alpha-galactosidase